MSDQHQTSEIEGGGSPEMWRGLEEYMDTPDFREMLYREFPEDATEWTDPVSRRKFLTLMGASAAFAGAVGCSPRPMSPQSIIPYIKQDPRITAGLPLFFATAAPLDGVGVGVLVKSYEGRPVKIEGNPKHPGSLGSSDSITQASLLTCFDPDRSQSATIAGTTSSIDTVITEVRALIAKSAAKKGAGLAFLTPTITSPTLAATLNAIIKDQPEAKWVQYDAVGDAAKLGAKKAFGKPANVVYDFTKADIVVTLDADFMDSGPGNVRYSRDFASRRKVRSDARDGGTREQMNRLYAVESFPTATGSMADHRLALKPSEIETFGRILAKQLQVPGVPDYVTLQDSTPAMKWAKPLGDDLLKKKGKSIVIAGESQPPSVHALALAINQFLGNIGQTVLVTAPLEAKTSENGQLADLKSLTDAMKAGKVETLFIFDVNAALTAPADYDFGAALDKVAEVGNAVHHGLYQDETAIKCRYHVPATHFVEAWGDIRGYDGTVTIQQPLIEPIFGGISPLEFLAQLINRSEIDGRLQVRAYWYANPPEGVKKEDFTAAWESWLNEGVVPNTALKAGGFTLGNWAEGAPKSAEAKGFEVAFRADPTLHDGQFANNGWLQEVPKPITKVTWDNCAYMGLKTAEELGVVSFPRWTAGERGRTQVDRVNVTVKVGDKEQTLDLPVWILPGHPDGVITLHLGFGRERAGRVGNGVGVNVYPARSSAAQYFAAGTVAKTDGDYLIGCTQTHHNMEGRKPIRHETLEGFKADKYFARATPAAPGESSLIYDNVPGPEEHRIRKQVHDHSHEKPAEGEENPKGEKKDDNKEDHKHEHHHDPRIVPLTMYNEMPMNGYRWAMAIDLTACNGCSACLIACVSENNGPVVGKEQVTAGREMHWIRIDRYYTVEGAAELDKPAYDAAIRDPNKISTFVQPVPCQQCEKAPCEIVCPVAATVHSADGLNDMVYNRCVGTRYCSNNCPYKVRRFNFLTYGDFTTESIKLMRNPEVTVRSRGVMEKCTYCVQRIRLAEIEAQREKERVKDGKKFPRGTIFDGEIVTACQSACPSGAIMFGDIATKDSVVNRWKMEPTNYGLLMELNTMPRTTYLAALRNPNPDMPKGA